MSDIAQSSNVEKESAPFSDSPQAAPVAERPNNSESPSPSPSPSPTEHDAHPHVSTRQGLIIIAACTLAMMYNIGAGPAMAVALPDIGKDLGIPAGNLQWIISAYSLTSGCFLLLFGRLADLHGRKLVWLSGMAWTAAWALGCGFAPSEIALDTMRGLQGLGPAAAVPASLGILAHTFEMGSTRRTVAFATFSSGAPIGAALGFVITSILTEYTGPGWKSSFYFQSGLASFAFILGLIFIPPSTHHHALSPSERRVDWVGAGLITSGLVLLTFSIGDGETAAGGWKSAYIIALLVVGAVLVGAFVGWEYHLGGWKDEDVGEGGGRVSIVSTIEDEKRDVNAQGLRSRSRIPRWMRIPRVRPEAGAPRPLLKLSILRRESGKLGIMCIIGFFVWAGFSGWTLYAVLYYQTYLGLSPVNQMVRMLPMPVVGICCNVIVALAVARLPGIILVVVGCLMTSIAPLLFAVIDTKSTYWAFGFPAAAFSVFGADFIFAGGSIFVAKVARQHEQSLAGGLFNTMTQIGTSIGLSISSIVLDKRIVSKAHSMGDTSISSGGAAADNAPPEALLAGYRAAQWLCFAYVMTGLMLAVFGLRDIGVIARKPPKGAAGGNGDGDGDDREKGGREEGFGEDEAERGGNGKDVKVAV